jgi:phage shock protein E
MSYSEKFAARAEAARARVPATNPQDVPALMAAGAIVLDIRDPDEHAAAHIPGSVALSRGKLDMNIEALIPDPETPILCYCNAQNRGALSAQTLREMGYVNASWIDGGLNAWRKLQD